MPHDRSFAASSACAPNDDAPSGFASDALPFSLPAVQVARSRLHDAPPDVLHEILRDPWVHDALPELVPLLKGRDVLACVRVPDLAARLVPSLSPAQCKLIGPELASHVAPHLAGAWRQLAHLPIETVVMMPASGFAVLPATVL